jgi:hypothetical protein
MIFAPEKVRKLIPERLRNFPKKKSWCITHGIMTPLIATKIGYKEIQSINSMNKLTRMIYFLSLLGSSSLTCSTLQSWKDLLVLVLKARVQITAAQSPSFYGTEGHIDSLQTATNFLTLSKNATNSAGPICTNLKVAGNSQGNTVSSSTTVNIDKSLIYIQLKLKTGSLQVVSRLWSNCRESPHCYSYLQ